ncbi:MAG: shikimate kinase [Elainellaceae cyanobacterium]
MPNPQAAHIKTQLNGINVYLIGMMGAGKTTVGRHLAQLLQYQFFDTDQVVEQAAGQSIAQIFADAGEADFRQMETQVLSKLCAYQRLVVATGGGIVLAQENWSYLHYGAVVWLNASVDTLYRRLSRDTSRPLLQRPNPRQVLQDLLDERQSRYAQADLVLETEYGEKPQDVARRLLVELDTVIKPTAVDGQVQNGMA